MKLSRNWLQHYVNLKDRSDAEIEQALTLIGFEVEGIEQTGVQLTDNIVVGEVESREPHPNADRLSVSLVNVGDGTSRHIVCGAKNYQVGDRVFVALPGARVLGPEREPFKIKKSKLRGEPSEGMMCSARELGMGQDHAGLLILEERPAIGTPIDEVLTDNDSIFDIEVTPNRPDCLSHLGMARELAAWFDERLNYPEIEVASSGETGQDSVVKRIRVEAEEECPLYFGFSIRGVSIGPSPDWLKKAIEAVGLRSINNVVDITNYVLLEMGQPLHAFDAAKIRGQELIIRQARSGESITTLDDRKRELSSSMTVIADADRPLVVGGVMGSIDAEVDESTRDILLEAAYFRSRMIRKTSRRLGLSTDSSYRFERGIDPQNVEFAALRAIGLILQVAGGSFCGNPIQVGTLPPDTREIPLDPQFVRDRLGFGPDNREIERLLNLLELDVRIEKQNPDEELWTVGIPSFRRDLERPIDLVEEVLRIHGCDQIPDSSVLTRVDVHKSDLVAQFLGEGAAVLVGRQFQECLHYTLRSEEEIRNWFGHAETKTLGLANPLTSDQSHLRPSLVPGLLDALRLNLSRGTGLSRLFERGRVFREIEGTTYEVVSFAFLIHIPNHRRIWKNREPADFYTTKAVLEELLNCLGVEESERDYVTLTEEAAWQGGHSAKVGDLKSRRFEAKLGLLSLATVKGWDIDGLVYAGSLLVLPERIAEEKAIQPYRSFSPYPPVAKDLALVVDASLPAGKVRSDLRKAAEAAAEDRFEVESVDIFDVYEGDGLPEGTKSLALSMVFRSSERTLNDKEVNEAFEAIQKTITENTDYTLRS